MDRADLPPLAMLRAFEATARHLGFSAAGRELNVTHVAVSQQVRRLEDHLGARLITRSGRRLELTPEGAQLAGRVIEGFDILRRAFTDFAAASSQRPLRVTLTPMFAATWLMPRLAEFRAEHPAIELMLNPTPDLIDLRRDDYDLAIRYGPHDWPGVEAEPFIHSGFIIVAAPALIEGLEIEEPADLVQLPWLLQQGNDEFDSWLATHGVRVPGKHNLTHLPGYMIIPAARDGQGIAMASRVLVEEDLAAGRLVALFEELDESERRTGYYLIHRAGPLREPLRVFIDWLKRAARADRNAPVPERPRGLPM